MQSRLFQTQLACEPREVALLDIEAVQLKGAGGHKIPSVAHMGVLQPILLAPPGEPGGQYRLIEGRRRVHSARLYGLTHIPALLTDGTPAQLAAASAVANLARKANPVGEAQAIGAVLSSGSATLEELAQEWGVGLGTLRARLKLLELPGDVLDGVGHDLALGVARKMAALSETYRDKAVSRYRVASLSGEAFGLEQLKEVTTAREGDLSDLLGDVLEQPILLAQESGITSEEFTLSELADELADEVAQRCAEAGYPLGELLEQLALRLKSARMVQDGQEDSVPDLSAEPFETPVSRDYMPPQPPQRYVPPQRMAQGRRRVSSFSEEVFL